MPGYVLLASEKGSPLTPNQADDNLKNLYDYKAEKDDVVAVADRTTVLEASQAVQDAELVALADRTTALENTQNQQDVELAAQGQRISDIEAELATHDHDAAEITFTPAGEITETNVQAAIEQVDAIKQSVDDRGQPGGYAPLDTDGRVPIANLPAIVASNKGYFATLPELEAAYPTADPGSFATVGTTDTVWTWDADTAAWVNTGKAAAVESVNGQTGAVSLDASGIPFTPVGVLTATDTQIAIEQARGLANAKWIDDIPVDTTGIAAGNILQAVGPAGSEQLIVGPLIAVQTYVFTSPSTFILPPGAAAVQYDVISGGAGGASGSSVTGAGGAGGTGGGRTTIWADAAGLAASQAVLVGSAGLGGVAAAGDGHIAGTDGGESYVVTGRGTVTAPRGRGATSNAAVAGSAGAGVISAVASGAGSTNTFVGGSVSATYATALAGGSGGGGGSASGTQGSAGGSGGGGGLGSVTGSGGQGGATNGGVGADAPQSGVLSDYAWETSTGGSGGGGGELSGGKGSKGDGYGSGGGGGGGCGPGNVPGAGGDGQPGRVVIRVFFGG